MLSQQLLEFAKIGEFSLEKFGCQTDKKVQKNFKEDSCKYLQNINLFIIKFVFWNTGIQGTETLACNEKKLKFIRHFSNCIIL